MRTILIAVALLLSSGCEGPPYVVDQFPIIANLDAGVPILIVRAPDLDTTERHVLVDTSSPVTVLDVGVDTVSRRLLSLDVVSDPTAPPSPPELRARFTSVEAILASVGSVGVGPVATPIGGVLGGDVLSLLAFRIDPQHSQLRFFPDIAGSNESHEDACEAVLSFTLAGGGTFINGADQVKFLPTRVVIGACTNADDVIPSTCAGSGPCNPSGQDNLLLLATGVGPTVLSRSAFKRATGITDDAVVNALPTVTVHLSSDRSPGLELHHAVINRMALVAHEGNRGPCAELLTGRLMASGGCSEALTLAGDCPCQDASSCASGAAVEMTQGFDVVMLEDTDPLLQGLRNELRPAVADIDGLIGMDAIRNLVTDIDYPNGRAIVHCQGNVAICSTRPRIADVDRMAELENVWQCFP